MNRDVMNKLEMMDLEEHRQMDIEISKMLENAYKRLEKLECEIHNLNKIKKREQNTIMNLKRMKIENAKRL